MAKKKFKYEVEIEGNDGKEADRIMNALMRIYKALSSNELFKVEETVSNPLKLSLIKAKLL
jgi:hypothetical protein